MKDNRKALGKALDELAKAMKDIPELADKLDLIYEDFAKLPGIEYLNQTQHANRLGVARSTIWRRQKESNLYKTEIIGAVEHYVWIDGEPIINARGVSNG